jgi:competence protein ComEC
MKHLLLYLSRQSTAERESWVLWLPVFIGVGVGGYFGLNREPLIWFAGIGVVGAAAGIFVFNKNFKFFVCFIGLLAIAIGFAAAQHRTLSVAHTVLQKRIGPTTITGRVDFVENFARGPRITIEKVRLSLLRAHETPERVRLTLRGRQPDLTPGHWINLRAVLTPPPAPVMPGSFDFQRRFYFMEIGATGFGLGPAKIVASQNEGTHAVPLGTSINLFVANLRQSVAQNVRRIIPGAIGGVAAALMTGDRSGIPKQELEAFRQSGLAHLLAISGLHIGLIAGLLFGGFRAGMALVPVVALRYPIKKWAAFLAILGAFSYAVMAGATVPTQRAFLMVGLVLVAVLADREGISMRLVAWAATAILILRPESLLGASFQLSFAAVVALIAAYEFLRERELTPERATVWRRPVRYIGGVALTTIIATLATSPFAIYHFNQMAQFGLIANILAVPLTAIWVMPFAVSSFILMPIGLADIALIPMGWGVGAIIDIAQLVSSWEGSVLTVPSMPVSALVAIGLGGLWLCLWQQRWRLIGGGAIALGLSSIFFFSTPDIIVDEKGKLFAVQGTGGTLHLSSKRVSKFAGELWLRRVGQRSDVLQNWPKTGFSTDKSLVCDRLGCIYQRRGHKVALITNSQAVPEDCQMADIVVSAVPVPWSCPAAKLVIDWFDL